LVSEDPGCPPVAVLTFAHVFIYVYGVHYSGFVRVMVGFAGRVCTVTDPAIGAFVAFRPSLVYLVA